MRDLRCNLYTISNHCTKYEHSRSKQWTESSRKTLIYVTLTFDSNVISLIWIVYWYLHPTICNHCEKYEHQNMKEQNRRTDNTCISDYFSKSADIKFIVTYVKPPSALPTELDRSKFASSSNATRTLMCQIKVHKLKKCIFMGNLDIHSFLN